MVMNSSEQYNRQRLPLPTACPIHRRAAAKLSLRWKSHRGSYIKPHSTSEGAVVLALGCASLNVQTYMLETPICSAASHCPSTSGKAGGIPQNCKRDSEVGWGCCCSGNARLMKHVVGANKALPTQLIAILH